MNSSNYDVIVVGAGAAGLSAAIGLAKAGFTVAVVEAAAFPGAENWSGCVYFCESLAHPDLLGPEGVEALAWERRLVERGFFATDGFSLLGSSYRDAAAFQHCYTVLRPIYDHHLAQVALKHGVALITETTAESLIRDERGAGRGERGRIIGVCTNRGALYADLVFLAEGDASHLVTREGYERFTDQRDAPKFLQGIKQVIDMPAGAIEEIFGVGSADGVAYEMLVRNGSLRGKSVHLNMGGFLYTNRRSLSLGLVLPADNLHEHFGGDPNLLLEWFTHLPALNRWLKDGQPGVFGAKIIRGGGARDIPHLVDDGLAIGGAASAIGIDFPYPNFTGPATLMGLLLVQAAQRIRAEGAGFTRDSLHRHYLEPLHRSQYWKDVEFLRSWPSYVKRTTIFFGRNLDLALGTAYVWTRPRRWFLTKWTNWLRLVLQVAGPQHWPELQKDARHLTRALRLREVTDRPPLWRLVLDGTVNALRDLFHRPRPNLPQAGVFRLHYSTADDVAASLERVPVRAPHAAGTGGRLNEETGLPPRPLQRWFRRFAPVLASVARRVYANDGVPLTEKLPSAIRLLIKQVNIFDLLVAGGVGLAALVSATFLVGWDRFLGMFRRSRAPRGLYPRYAEAARQACDLTPSVAPAAQNWEARLAQLSYQTVKESHIQVLWPRELHKKNAVVDAGLWHVCPAHVYEARVNPQGQLQVVVNFENCIKCETCWRTSDLVSWARDGKHRFIYPVSSPAMTRLLDTMQEAGMSRPALPYLLDYWEPDVRAFSARLPAPGQGNGQQADFVAELQRLVDQLDTKLQEYDAALAEEPRLIDRSRAEYVEMLTRYAQRLAARMVEVIRGSVWVDHPQYAAAHQQLLDMARTLAAKAEQRSRHTWDQRYQWAAASGRQLRFHHIPGLRRLLAVVAGERTKSEERKAKSDGGSATPRSALARSPLPALRSSPWLRAEAEAHSSAEKLAEWIARLDGVFGPAAWRELERQVPLTSEQDAALRDLLAQVPAIDPANLSATLHPPLRKALLAELGRRDPSLAYRVAAHLWARDLATLTSGSTALKAAAQRWTVGDEWACYAAVDAAQGALFVPALGAQSLLLLVGDQMMVVPRDGLPIEPLATLGLRGAGLARLLLDGFTPPDSRSPVDHQRVQRIWSTLSACDLTSIATGMARQLCRRAIDHATGRVQFPGLFHDEDARDTIGKFGAIKKMVAEMEARRYLIETMDHALTPVDFSTPSRQRAGLVKAVVAEALGSAPGSLSYNAGQVFGGTGYSEDDILSKFYRDAAAWRFLGPSNVDIHRHHGHELLAGWSLDGQRLATLSHEVELFEEIAQRKALQGELDEIRNLRSRLRVIVGDWQEAAVDGQAARAEVAEELARQDAHLLASKTLLVRTHARLEHGLNAEVEIALMRVWLEAVAVWVEQFDRVVRHRLHPPGARDDRPVVEPAAGPPVLRYADYLAADLKHDSGDFLSTPVDLTQPRFVPELIAADPTLAEANRHFRELLSSYFGQPRQGPAGPEIYERHIERLHRPDAADLDFCRKHGFFRMPIPKELGGEGRSKADYYLLTTNAQRLADVAISLTIQANTSIGTTPVLLARDKDLPKAQKDLAPFVADAALHSDVQVKLQGLLRLFEVGDPRRIESAYRKLHQQLEEKVFAKTVVKVLTHRFGEAWQQAGRAGLAFDLPGMRARLEDASKAWKDACGKAADRLAELARRREACDLFLRWVASGQISAFALTEPSAGSDTARVATRARLCSVPVEAQPDGVYRFVPAHSKDDTPRFLLDAKHLDFRGDGVYYRWPESVEPARIGFDEYDYETDDPTRMRYLERGGRRIHFTDVAQLRERDGRLWYDYWELTGAKMWITNGRMSGIMALYAKIDEGVTGFIVDRHAEGLVVGKDEAKMGQCGSPTNELSLQAVRVPRENLIGLEGRGQVNALETLNVGRAGLAMSAMAQLAGLIDSSRAHAKSVYGEVPDWAAWRLERMEEDRFTAEALAHEVIGRFEHPRTRSARMESAISKMLVSELLHRVIETAEDIHGLAGQTQLHLVEKRKRDARILNIYEGTNEVQRFLILKELAGEVAPRWSQAATAANHLGREALELEACKAEVRQRIDAALALFGQELWQNPSLQSNCFVLAESAAWLKAADSTLGRLAWLSRLEFAHEATSDEPEATSSSGEPQATAPSTPLPPLPEWPTLDVARRALARCLVEVRDRLQRFDEELTYLRRGYYAPEVRAARLLFQHAAETEHDRVVPPAQIERPLRVLVIVEPSAVHLPQPHVVDGRLLEPHLTLSDGDRAALETALRLREDALAKVTIEVAAVGPRRVTGMLREVISLGVDRVLLLVPEGEAVTPDSAATALASILKPGPAYDLILSGASGFGEEDGLLAHLTALALDVPHAGSASRLLVHCSAAEAELRLLGKDRPRIRALPAAVSVEAGLALRPFHLSGYLAGLAQIVELHRWPKKTPARQAVLSAATHTGAAVKEEQPLPLTPEEAAQRLLAKLGRGGATHGPASYDGAIDDVAHPALLETGGHIVVTVLAAENDGRLQPSALTALKAARLLAGAGTGARGIVPARVVVLLLAPALEESQRRALAQLLDWHRGAVVVLSTSAGSADVHGRLLAECWPRLARSPVAIVGEPWAEFAFAALATRRAEPLVMRVRRLVEDKGKPIAETSQARGKLRARQVIDPGPTSTEKGKSAASCWITLAADADIDETWPADLTLPVAVQRWTPRLERFYARGDIQLLLDELRQETGLTRLGDADFIIDVGFGVGNRDGYEEVIVPLEQTLRALGVRNLVVGGSRKVTEELHLLPPDRQIGQSGVSVNPRIMLAIGISGAPQHLNYIGGAATILAFNHDADAPLMTLNQRQPRPRVFPIVGDLFDTVPALAAALQQEVSGQSEPVAPHR